MSRRIRLSLLVALLVGCAGSVLWLRENNARLRRRVAELHRQNAQVMAAEAENARARALIARASGSDADAADATRAEITRLKAELTEHERRIEERRAKNRAAVASLAMNRDPAQGFVPMENFQNLGNATPRDAFQTLAWAAMHGDDRLLASLVTFDDRSRAAVEAYRRRLPSNAAEKFPTAESLAGLLFANVITGTEAARVLDENITDPRHATVTIAFPRAPSGQAFPMQLGPHGWQLAISEAMLPDLERALRPP
jgi:hypothetical protein